MSVPSNVYALKLVVAADVAVGAVSRTNQPQKYGA